MLEHVLDTLRPRPGLPFSSSYRTPASRWWKGAFSIVVVVAAVLVITTVGSLVATVVELVLGTQDPEALTRGIVAVTPGLLLATNLSLAAAGAVAIVAHRYVSGVRVSFFPSVRPGFRWRWLAVSTLIAAPFYLVFAASSFLDPAFRVTESPTLLAFLVVIVLTTPLQAAAEEFLFRGVIQRAAGSWVRSPRGALVVGTVVSATVFSAAHFAADPWLIAYYFLFGAGLSVLAQRSGGVESGIAIHTVNNVFLLAVAAMAGEMDAGFDRSAGVGSPVLLLPILMLAVVIAILSWLARRVRLALVTPVVEIVA
ncbi:CPBP family intramembrane glutamic endopeptidase [Microbacterium sp. P05]|uniref:CPBP family intramembrane glutamic endopeptidase n=1 Tax=Microbacterium sp. P05 TaxID=3366948 RepID=UPI00374762AF